MAGYVTGMTRADQRLLMAAKNGRIEDAMDALALGARAGVIDADGETALHALAEKFGDYGDDENYREFARSLIEAGCSVDQASRFGCTALMSAAYFNKKALVKELHERGARLDGSLHFVVAQSNYVEMAELLISLGCNVLALDKAGASVLEKARTRWGGPSMEMVSFIEAAVLSAQISHDAQPPRPAFRI